MADARAELDDTDKAIIRALQLDGRTPYSKLGPAVGLSQAAARQRVQRLIDRGVMQVVAVTDPATLGFAVQAMVAVCVTGDVRQAADAHRRRWPRSSTSSSPRAASTSWSRWCAPTCSTCSSVVNDHIRAVHGVTSTEVFTYLSLVKQTYSWGVR